MPIKVVLADDSQVMLSAMRRTLAEDPRIQIVGEASTFEATVQMIAEVKPDVLLIALHLPESELEPDFVKSQLASVPCTLAVSFANDGDAKALAGRYGATSLLDKMNLYQEMILAIIGC